MSSFRSVFRDDLFDDKTAIVTGGGSGIGRCIAHELAHLGAHVVLMGRTLDKLETVASEIEDDGGQASFETCDIRKEERVKEVIANVVADRGRIDMLVNNAGGQFAAPLVGISKNGWDAVVGTNLTGGFLMAREAFDQSMKEDGGVVVNILADMWRGMPGMGHSGAARAGMQNFTKTAAVEWAGAGVRVNAVAPGWIASSGMDTYPDYVKATIPQLRENVLFKRLGTESEISAAVCFLMSPAAAFMTGETVSVDGGAPLYPGNFPIPDHDTSKAFDGFHRSSIPEFLREHVNLQEDD
jgi:citronellol/citronellal dehydrogenase